MPCVRKLFAQSIQPLPGVINSPWAEEFNACQYDYRCPRAATIKRLSAPRSQICDRRLLFVMQLILHRGENEECTWKVLGDLTHAADIFGVKTL